MTSSGHIFTVFIQGLVLWMRGLYAGVSEAEKDGQSVPGLAWSGVFLTSCTLEVMLLCNETHSTAVFLILSGLPVVTLHVLCNNIT